MLLGLGLLRGDAQGHCGPSRTDDGVLPAHNGFDRNNPVFTKGI